MEAGEGEGEEVIPSPVDFDPSVGVRVVVVIVVVVIVVVVAVVVVGEREELLLSNLEEEYFALILEVWILSTLESYATKCSDLKIQPLEPILVVRFRASFLGEISMLVVIGGAVRLVESGKTEAALDQNGMD